MNTVNVKDEDKKKTGEKKGNYYTLQDILPNTRLQLHYIKMDI